MFGFICSAYAEQQFYFFGQIQTRQSGSQPYCDPSLQESLSAFCEDVKVLESYVDLSQSTIKEKKIAKRLPIIKLLTDLPVELIQAITNKFESLLKIKLVEWIKESEIFCKI